MSWDQIDTMVGKDSEITHMINNMIEIIEGPMKSEYLGMIMELKVFCLMQDKKYLLNIY